MFYEKYLKATKEKGSFININLDPALPKQRKENVVPDRYASKDDEDTLLNFSLDIIEQVSDYCCSVKPNTQYYLGHTGILKKVAKKIRHEGMLAILDHKLSDIGSTNGSALYWINEMDFDAFTYSPFAGNTQKTVLITGCSTGIGYCVANGLKQRGYRVIATARREQSVKQLINEGFESLLLDLSDSQSIKQAFE